MDVLLEKWLDYDYDFFATNQAASVAPGSIFATYSTLDIIENGLKVFIDYCYKNCLKIKNESSGDSKLLPGFRVYDFEVEGDDCDLQFRFDVGQKVVSTGLKEFVEMTGIMSMDIYCFQYEILKSANGDIKHYIKDHTESLDALDFQTEVSQLRAAQLIRNIIDYILSDQNLDAYFLVQGINVRNFNI